MKTADFEKAIEALGVQGLEMTKFSYGINGQVAAVYARMGTRTYLKWDHMGRGFFFNVEEDISGTDEPFVPEINFPEYLDYRRDADFDLRFE